MAHGSDECEREREMYSGASALPVDSLPRQHLHPLIGVPVCWCRREVLPLVCKAWAEACGPDSPVWESCELSVPPRAVHMRPTNTRMHWHNALRCVHRPRIQAPRNPMELR